MWVQIVRVDRQPVVEEVGDLPEAPSIPLGYGENQKTQRVGSSTGSNGHAVDPKAGQSRASPSNPAQGSRRADAKPGGSSFSFLGVNGRLQGKEEGEPTASLVGALC